MAIDNPNALLRAIKQGHYGEVGKINLPQPLGSVSVGISSLDEVCFLYGQVTFDDSFLNYYEDKDGKRKSGELDESRNNLRDNLLNFAKKMNPRLKDTNQGGSFNSYYFMRNNDCYINIGSYDETFSGNRYAPYVRFMARARFYKDGDDFAKRLANGAHFDDQFNRALIDFQDIFPEFIDEIFSYCRIETPNSTLTLSPAMLGEVSRDIPIFEETSKISVQELPRLESLPTTFDDIGGYEEVKTILKNLASGISNQDAFKRWGTKSPKGILLHGPPGTGKTLMAKALANEANTPFFHIEVSDIGSKWYGESEKMMKEVFNKANNTGAPSIIFFDEIDALGQSRDLVTASGGAHNRVLATLLENLDGFAANDSVTVIASTNRLRAVDPALQRPGRFDRKVHIPLPDYESRRQILDVHLNKAENSSGRTLFDRFGFDEIVTQLEDLSGADIAEIVRRVLEKKAHEEISFGRTISNLVYSSDMLYEISRYEKTSD